MAVKSNVPLILFLSHPHTQFSPFALIDYTRAITPIRGRPYGDFCRAFDAEEGRGKTSIYSFFRGEK
jgi:hypothetical protein